MADEEFAQTGLSSSYAFLLMTVNWNPGIQPKEISEHMQLTPSTVTRLIEKMEYKNLLQRKPVGKFTEVYPTERGKALVEQVKTAWLGLYKRYSEIIGEEEGKKLTSSIYNAAKKLES